MKTLGRKFEVSYRSTLGSVRNPRNDTPVCAKVKRRSGRLFRKFLISRTRLTHCGRSSNLPLLALGHPFFHVVALPLLEFRAIVDPLQALLQCALSAGCAMVGKKLLNVIMHGCGAKSAQSGNRAASAKGCHLFGQCVPMRF